MTSIGAARIRGEHGGPLGVAEALLEGRLDSHDQAFLDEIVSPILLEAARIRLEAKKTCLRCGTSQDAVSVKKEKKK